MSDVGGFKLWLILMAFCIVALISIGMLMTSAASVFYWSELFGPTGGVLAGIAQGLIGLGILVGGFIAGVEKMESKS